MARHPSVRLAVLGCLVLLTGCGDSMSRTFGLTKDAPDEFTVVTRAPLSMPPNFDLRPPQPGAPRPQEQTASQNAEAALDPQAALAEPHAATSSPGQDALLQAAGPAPAPNIRAQVDHEAATDTRDEGFADRLMFWKPPPPKGTVVDAQAEADRLKQNAALGASPETGDTPVIRRKPRGLLEGIF